MAAVSSPPELAVGPSNEPSAQRQRDLDLAIELARSAGKLALEHYGNVERLLKTHATTTDEPVTVADRAAQAAIVKGLRHHCPSDGIIGEESEFGDGITASNLQPKGRNWVIDPIDGTNNFIAGLGNWAVCIGLLEAGVPTVGVVYDVTRDVVYAGGLGIPATANGEPVGVVEHPMSTASLFMLTSNLLDAQGRAPAWVLGLLNQTDWKVRMLGSAALEATMVGAGIAQVAITMNGKLWDAVAACAFSMSAGADVLTLEGEPLFPFDVTEYRGRKVPFLCVARQAKPQVLRHLRDDAD